VQHSIVSHDEMKTSYFVPNRNRKMKSIRATTSKYLPDSN